MEKNYIDTKRLSNIENKLFFLTDSEKVKISIESGNIELSFLGTVVIDSRGMKSRPFGGKLLCPPGHYGYISLSQRKINLVEKTVDGKNVSYYNVDCGYMSVYRNFYESCQIRLQIGPIGAMSVVDKNDILCINYNGERYINPSLIDFISGNLSMSSFSNDSNSGISMKNPVLLWGRSFDGTKDITGPLKSVTYVDLTNTGENVMTPNDKTKKDNRVWYGLGMEVSTNSSFVAVSGSDGLDLYTGTNASTYVSIYSGKNKEPGRLKIGESVFTYDPSTKNMKLYGAKKTKTGLYISDTSTTSIINGSLNIKKNLIVSGSTNLENTSVSKLSASGVVSVSDGLTVNNGIVVSSGGMNLTGSLTVNGSATMGNAYVSNIFFNSGGSLSKVSASSGKISFTINGYTYNVSTF